MKKIIILLLIVVFVVSISFIGISCKRGTTETTTAVVTSEEETTTEETTGGEELDPRIAEVWARVDQFRVPIDPEFKGPNGETVTLDTDSLKLTVDEVKMIQEGNYKIAISWNTLNGEYFTAWRQGSLDCAEYLNMDIVAEASCEFDAAKQLSDIESMIPLNPDVIIASPIDPVGAAKGFKPAIDAGIKLAFISNIPEGYVKGRDYIGIATSNAWDWGVFAFELIYDIVGSGGKIAAMPTETNYWFNNVVTGAFLKEVEESDIDLLETAGYVTFDDAYKTATAIVLNHPDVEAIYIDFCTPGAGVINALKDAGRIEDIDLVTGAADEPGLLSLINGDFDGIAGDVTYLVGWNAVLEAAYGILGKEGPDYAVCPAIKITVDNIREVWAAGKGIPLPASVDEALKEKGL